MPDHHPDSKERRRALFENFRGKVEKKEARRIKGKQHEDETVWFGLGMFGVVGWSVAVPTLVGVAIGLWIDRTFPSKYSWTLMLLIIGVAIGCWNAWYWVKKAGRRIEEED
ncbi:MAG: putative rane protein [Deltaproteobacteria bacterium]|nr:putative rane protein [Deltaproteobacteria bacterium]